MRNVNITLGLVAASLALAVSAPASARIALNGTAVNATALDQAEPDTMSFSISYADLNLASTAGQKALNGRVAGLIRKVCGTYFIEGAVGQADHGVTCRAQAKAQTAPQIALAVTNAHQRMASAATTIEFAAR